MPASSWSLPALIHIIAADRPEQPALVHGDRHLSWSQLRHRAQACAAALTAAGLGEQSKVAQYLYNCPEYIESVIGACTGGFAVANTNYRYGPDELVYLWDNADAEAVIFHGTFTDTVDAVRVQLPSVRLWIHVDDGSTPCPTWAVDYESMLNTESQPPGPEAWSGDHLILLYTGGTTGMPKGVMWRQEDLIGALDASNRQRLGPAGDHASVIDRMNTPGPRGCPAAPLMHGTGLFNALSTLLLGGTVITLEGRTFSPVELLDTVQAHGVNSVALVGDAFARPILAELDAAPDRWDISSLRVIVSSGVMWSQETKSGLARHNERLIMVDTLGSSEAIGMASNISRGGDTSATARFALGPHTRVITDDGDDVVPGSGQRGRVALRGHTPIGYYKDPVKSAGTFVEIDGARYSIPGDWAEVAADGTVVLLGRGSQCINTGGEKVYPEEVEEVLKTHPQVIDVAVVGLPDERFGQTICAIVQATEPSPDPQDLIEHVRARIARYKAPRRIVFIDDVGRAPNGKLDYRRLTDLVSGEPTGS